MSTFVVASNVSGTNVIPMPIDITAIVGKTSARYVLCVVSCVKYSIPTSERQADEDDRADADAL